MLTAQLLSMRFRQTFRISRSARDVQHNALARFERDGLVGWGEAAPSAYYRGQTAESARAAIEAMARLVADDSVDREALAERLRRAFPDQPSARNAVEMALLDWAGKRAGLPLASLLGLPAGAEAETAFTISLGSPEEARASALHAAGAPILKLKLGGGDDLALVRAVREVSPARLWVDANAAWSLEEACVRCAALAELGVELIEQPIAPGSPESLRSVRRESPVPIVADEDCLTAEDVYALTDAVDGVNIKLAKTGGLHEALRTAMLARSLGLGVMLGTMVESSLGTAAMAHLLPLARWVDLDGPLLLRSEDDPWEGLCYAEGSIRAPRAPGVGVSLRAPAD